MLVQRQVRERVFGREKLHDRGGRSRAPCVQALLRQREAKEPLKILNSLSGTLPPVRLRLYVDTHVMAVLAVIWGPQAWHCFAVSRSETVLAGPADPAARPAILWQDHLFEGTGRAAQGASIQRNNHLQQAKPPRVLRSTIHRLCGAIRHAHPRPHRHRDSRVFVRPAARAVWCATLARRHMSHVPKPGVQP